MSFIWYDKFYYIPWAKGALNRHLPAKLVDNIDADFDYRTAVQAWRENAKLGSSYVMDAATQNSLIKMDRLHTRYVKWLQICLALSGEDPSLVASGSMDQRTIEAIKIFQENEMGYKSADGVVGPKTETALMLRTNVKPPGRCRPVPKFGNFEIPPVIPKDDPEPYYKTHSSTWFGIGVKVGGMSVTELKGDELVRAHMMNWDKPESTFRLEIEGSRRGMGGGASASWVFVMVTGIYEPSTLNGIELGSMDFSLAAGGKWSSLIKNVKAVKHIDRLVSAARAGKWAGSLPEILLAADGLKRAITASLIDVESTSVDCKVVDVFGTGLELGVYYNVSKFKASGVHWAEAS